jgi:amino acid adenylation domain-containing protein
MSTWSSASRSVSLDFDGPVDVQFERFDESGIDLPLIEHFDRIAQRYAGRPAVADKIRSLTYDELRRWAYALARRVDQAAPPGRPVGILLPHNALFPVAALACLAAGRPYVPIDLKYPDARIEAIFQEAGLDAVILLAATDAAQRVPGNAAVIDLGSIPAADEQSPDVSRLPTDMAVILYTSGSTGKPKGICNDQRAILQRVAEATNSCHVNADDRFILLSSPATIAGVREMFAALLNGATLHVTDPQLDGIYSVLQTLGERRITIGYAVPSLLRMLLRLPGAAQAFLHLRVLRVGGDITLDSDLALFREIAPRGCHFFASFSSTETPAVFQWFVPQAWTPAGPRVPIGHARPGIDFMVLDEDGRSVRAGECGELVVRSRYLAVGQWQGGKLIPGPFMRDPHDSSLRILHTGDMVQLREDGLWELIGRKDRQVKMRGLRIDVGEVEAALRSCRSVMDAAVIARRSGSGEEVSALAAFVAPLDRHDDAALMAQLKQALNARVPQYMRPAAIRLVDAIPQLPGFKPDIRALEQLDREHLQHENVVALAELKSKAMHVAGKRPRAPADRRVAEAVKYAWTGVLGAKSYEADLPWDESNGDSLKAIELWFYVEDKLGFKLPLDALGEHTTPSRLVQTIEAHIAHAQNGRFAANPAAPLVFLLPGIQSDDPALVRFRAAFGDSVRFKTIDYPGWRQTVVSEATFDTIVETVHATICAEPDCEIYRLAGYSFGGIVAFEVAHRLLASGRRVDFLGLLDTRRWDLTHPGSAGRLDIFLGEPRRLPVEMAKAAMATLLRRRNFTPLSVAERLLMLHPTRLAFWFKRQLTRELRYQALRQWKPVPLDVPTTLFLSDAQWPGEPEDYGWDEMCRPLTKIRIGGDHGSIIQPPHRDSVCSGFLQALVPEVPGPRFGASG